MHPSCGSHSARRRAGPWPGAAGHAAPDQELIFSALRQVGLIVAEQLESGAGDTDEVITQLIAVLDTQELAAAMNRAESG
jgi:hypothetical protein